MWFNSIQFGLTWLDSIQFNASWLNLMCCISSQVILHFVALSWVASIKSNQVASSKVESCCIKSNWAVLSCIKLSQVVWSCIELSQAGRVESRCIESSQLSCVALDQVESCCIESNQVELHWIKYNWIELSWIELSQVKSNWIQLPCTSLVRARKSLSSSFAAILLSVDNLKKEGMIFNSFPGPLYTWQKQGAEGGSFSWHCNREMCYDRYVVQS
jgi:hypothetical protein